MFVFVMVVPYRHTSTTDMSSLPGEYGVDGHRVVHRRHAELIPGQAEVRPVDLDLAIQFHLRPVEAGDPGGEGRRTGAAPDGEGSGHGDILAGWRDLLHGEGDVRGISDIEEVGRAQVLIPLDGVKGESWLTQPAAHSTPCCATVSELAARLGLTLPTVSGVLADLDRADFVARHPDPADRRRTIVAITPAKAALVGEWLDGAASPIARVLDKLSPSEQEAFLKAMDLLETELHRQDTPSADTQR
jgi:DNA-binding MarR family transcriptional regulator